MIKRKLFYLLMLSMVLISCTFHITPVVSENMELIILRKETSSFDFQIASTDSLNFVKYDVVIEQGDESLHFDSSFSEKFNANAPAKVKLITYNPLSIKEYSYDPRVNHNFNPNMNVEVNEVNRQISVTFDPISNDDGFIIYTLDNSDPTDPSSNRMIYKDSLTITENASNFKYAIYNNYSFSEVRGLSDYICSAPEFSYSNGYLNITADSDSIIYYTTDGSEPTVNNGYAYSSAFVPSIGVTYRAVAYKDGYYSEIISYTYSKHLAAPRFEYLNGSISIFADEGATIYYTTDGSSPVTNHDYTYRYSLTPSYGVLYKAVAYKDGVYSDITSYSYYGYQVAAPKFSMDYGYLCITAEEGASIYYTTDGSHPSDCDRLFTDSFKPLKGVTYKAIAYKNGNFSEVSNYIYNNTISAPKFVPSEGALHIIAEEGALIYFTTDGSDPSISGQLYTNAFRPSYGVTYKAVAYKNGDFSENTSYTYMILSKPRFFESDGYLYMYADTGATIYYTKDGSDPRYNYHYTYRDAIVYDNRAVYCAVAYKDDEYSEITVF